MYHRYKLPTTKFPGEAFQKLEHEQDRQTDRHSQWDRHDWTHYYSHNASAGVNKQVPWLGSPEVWSASARLFAGTWRPLLIVITTLLCCDDYFSSSNVALRAFSILCMYSKFRHHPHTAGYTFVPNSVSFAASIVELAHGEKNLKCLFNTKSQCGL